MLSHNLISVARASKLMTRRGNGLSSAVTETSQSTKSLPDCRERRTRIRHVSQTSCARRMSKHSASFATSRCLFNPWSTQHELRQQGPQIDESETSAGTCKVLSLASDNVLINPVMEPVGTESIETAKCGSESTGNRVLITGSTKGIGRALAEQFLQAGDSVCVTSRSLTTVTLTVSELRAKYARRGVTVCGTPCDVRRPEDVRNLRLFAEQEMGGVDVWINNAGSNGYVFTDLVQTSPATIKEIIDTNVYGTIICCREAIRLMTTQPAGGHVFNMEGAGSDGNPTRMYAAYGFSKAGMGQLSKSLTDETRGSHVGIHTLSPGIVYTDLLQSGAHSFGRTGRFFINAVAETPGSVARALVPKIRRLVHQPGSARTTQSVKFLTPHVAAIKLYNRMAKGENRDRFFLENDPTDTAPQRLRLEWAPGFEDIVNDIVDVLRKCTKARTSRK